jgi:hypothetical protein
MIIRVSKNKWQLFNKAGTKVLGTHPTKKKARAQEAAILISKDRAARK